MGSQRPSLSSACKWRVSMGTRRDYGTNCVGIQSWKNDDRFNGGETAPGHDGDNKEVENADVVARVVEFCL